MLKKILHSMGFGPIEDYVEPYEYKLPDPQKTIKKHNTSIIDYQRQHILDPIIGYDDIKQLFYMALASDKPVHILLTGPPGTGKTMFLQQIDQHLRNAFFTVGSNTSKAGLVSVLLDRMPRYVCVDEIELMRPTDQAALLHLMETGIIAETKVKNTERKQLTSWVFATSNDTARMTGPLLSRFVIKQVPAYSYDQFREIAVTRLVNEERITAEFAELIAYKTWNDFGSADFRDAVKFSRMAKDEPQLDFVIRTLKK